MIFSGSLFMFIYFVIFVIYLILFLIKVLVCDNDIYIFVGSEIINKKFNIFALLPSLCKEGQNYLYTSYIIFAPFLSSSCVKNKYYNNNNNNSIINFYYFCYYYKKTSCVLLKKMVYSDLNVIFRVKKDNHKEYTHFQWSFLFISISFYFSPKKWLLHIIPPTKCKHYWMKVFH